MTGRSGSGGSRRGDRSDRDRGRGGARGRSTDRGRAGDVGRAGGSARRGDIDRDAAARRDRRTPSDTGGQVEGYHAVRELLTAGRRRVREVWLVDRVSGREELERLALDAGARIRVVSSMQLEERARSEAPQGVIAYADPVALVTAGDLLEAPNAFVVALDGVTDPGNLGAILRTADTAGCTGVVIPSHRSARLSPTALKAAAGAVEYLPIAAVAGIPAFLDQARRAGVWTVALDADGDADVNDLAIVTGPIVVVLGAEGAGVSRLARERCDAVASIPLHGHLESLNVSAAAAVALHAVARQRRGAESEPL